jgi:hypothetical protein
MITEEEYLKAKAIVEEYERHQFEEGHRQADWELEEEEEQDNDECDFCGRSNWLHYKGCIYNDPLDYNECGYG